MKKKEQLYNIYFIFNFGLDDIICVVPRLNDGEKGKYTERECERIAFIANRSKPKFKGTPIQRHDQLIKFYNKVIKKFKDESSRRPKA